jgi:hypothetical protein
MSRDRDTEIRTLIQRLTDDIKLARGCSLDLTVRLLQMAILDLQTVVMSMSDDDLRYLADALDNKTNEGNLSAFLAGRR